MCKCHCKFKTVDVSHFHSKILSSVILCSYPLRINQESLTTQFSHLYARVNAFQDIVVLHEWHGAEIWQQIAN